MNKKRVLIIGCGQLGARHLQSIGGIGEPLEIHIVDPKREALCWAVENYQKYNKKSVHKITQHSNLDNLRGMHFDVFISATTSTQRLESLKCLYGKNIVTKYVILEKVLFPSVSDVDLARDYFNEENVWVNCPRRYYPFYLDLKSLIQGPINLELIASNWGLGCNSIHYIDLVQFLTEEEPIEMNLSDLEKRVYSAKRDGFIEFYGTVEVSFGGGSQLRLYCSKEELDASLNILGKDLSVLINEPARKMKLNGRPYTLKVPFQSELTACYLEDLFRSGSCRLPSYLESAVAHRVFLKELTSFYQDLTKDKEGIIPIT